MPFRKQRAVVHKLFPFFFFYIILHPTKYITLVSAVILQFGKVNKKPDINLWHDSASQGESTCVISLSLMLPTPNDAYGLEDKYIKIYLSKTI